jgi:hypothetical protein
MSHWNYRILARKIETETQFGLYEVHYDDNDEPVGFTENSMIPLGFNDGIEDPVESIKWQLDAMKIATEKPILDYDHFPLEYLKYSRQKKLKEIEKYCQ